jgi:signal transduction histidine kinase/ActR/RegA family two-component response regulator
MLENKIDSMADMVALGVGIGLDLNNFQAVNKALNWAKRDKNLAYICVLGTDGEVFAEHNPKNVAINKEELSKKEKHAPFEKDNILHVIVPMKYKNDSGALILGFSLDALNQNHAENQKIILFISLAVFFIGIGLSFFLSGLITKPLSKLKIAVHEVAKGNMEATFQINSSDEIGELGRDFKIMMSKIQESNKKLNSAREEAEKANIAKSSFLSSMSHELRTPLNAILGFSQIIMTSKKEPLSPDQIDCMEHVMKGGRHLLFLINEVLDLSKIETGNLSVSLESFSLEKALQEALILTQPMAENNNIKINIQADSKEKLFVYADFFRLKQVFINLISNGIKYNCENGSVTIEYEKIEPDKAQVRIIDTGIGIPEEKLDDLFKPFNRLGIENSGIDGFGIGLTITLRLIDFMNGSLNVTSSEGKGSCFVVEIPLGQEINELKPSFLKEELSAPVNHDNDSFKILYIEDNPDNLSLVERILNSQEGIIILSAPEASIGLDLARTHHPNLILMDINLPGMDGITAMKKLKTFKETCEIPVIALSANALEADIKKAIAEGFSDYITKPLDVENFLETINSFVKTNN